MTMRRRDALKTIGGLAGAATLGKFLPGCSDESGPQGITTYVFLMMENRTYDHMLGARSLEGLPGDGLKTTMANPDINGTMVPVFKAPNDKGAPTPTLCDPDPPHGFDVSRVQFNAGAMDGFLKEHQIEQGNDAMLREPMKYLTRDHVPVYWALADSYTICDRWFASVMGPTLPNRAYWHAGTSFGIKVNAEVISKFGSGVPVPTIYNRLDEAGVDWAYYYGSLAVVSLLANPGPYQLDLGPMDGTGRVRRFGDSKLGGGQFFKDAAEGKLPPVVYIDPAFYTNDDHPPIHPIYGQELVGAIYTALAKSPQWKNIMFVVTYDEHGGYFDHVPPPTTVDDTAAKYGITGFDQMGFRVPTLVMGPYVKQGHVSSVVRDHTSALKHLQTTFGLASINPRIDAANDLSECIDEDRLARLDPAPPVTMPAINSEDYPGTHALCTSNSGFRVAGLDPISEFANKRPEAFSAPDLRGSEDIYLQSIRAHYNKNRV